MDLHGTYNGADVVSAARTWIGTRYHHQASVKGAGCDCIGLIAGVWMDLFHKQPSTFKMPKYTPNWSDETGDFAAMADYCKRYLIPIAFAHPNAVLKPEPGDILLYRMMRKGPTKHAGIMSAPGMIIHAYSRHAVMESTMPANAGSKLTHIFRYPESWTE